MAHQLAVIAIQAGAARMLAGPAGATAAPVEPLCAIEEASRAALRDVRRALGVLRGQDESEVDAVGGIPGGRGFGPQPTLDQLDELAARLRDAGLPLDITTSGDVGDLPVGIGVSAYRIVQEALTNVLNHAGRVATRVRVVRTPTELEVDVRNDPPISGALRAHGPGPGGRGVLGMRERAASYCGTLDAGPLPGGGFAVRAHIPLA
ncbi:MAG: sensor histidine kinase [Acidimicrobiales bacterium]